MRKTDHLEELPTPFHALNLNVLERNIHRMAAACPGALWPMAKTHKSTAIARMQIEAGAEGFLCGTLTEAEGLCALAPVMLAYPVAGAPNIQRVVELLRGAPVILSFDGPEAAGPMSAALASAGLQAEFLLLIDSGLHRFGVAPEHAVSTCRSILSYPNLRFAGIATHPGQVYAASGSDEVVLCAQEEQQSMRLAMRMLAEDGLACHIIATGSTPTAGYAAQSGRFTALRPGNYVFHDATQLTLGACTLSDCALTVEATVIAHPRPELFIIDAGAKSLALDRGAHGSSNIRGYGLVLVDGEPQPQLELASLSEEVGKLVSPDAGMLRVGQRVSIVPNHACPAANLARTWVLHRDSRVVGAWTPDLRG